MSENPGAGLDVPETADPSDDAAWRRWQALVHAAEPDSVLRMMLRNDLPLTGKTYITD